MSMNRRKFLLVRPPRYVWPFINESDNFLLPLGLPSVAAAVRAALPEIEVKIIDCLPLGIGWKSLRGMLEAEKPDFVGAGEEALYHHEALKLFAMAKEIDPAVKTIAGGHFFSWMPERTLADPALDYIVRFEGEETVVELLRTLLRGGDLSAVKGIAYRADGRIVQTPLRPLATDLDALPMPAFDLMPMNSYALYGRMWPRSATLEHGRGCIDHCQFCSLWTYWGTKRAAGTEGRGFDVSPRYRSKSVERTLEEVDVIYKKYGIRYVFWSDATFNADPKWTDAFCEGILKRGYTDFNWWAFMRADLTIRDEKLGVLEKMVRAGLVHTFIGVERACSEDFQRLHKSAQTRETTREVFGIFKRRYPHVYRQAGFVTCLPFETEKSMLELADHAADIDVDWPAFQVITPVPGTRIYEEVQAEGLLEEKDFSKYDWVTPLMPSREGLSRKQLADLNMEINRRFILRRPLWLLRGLFSPYPRKRGQYWWVFLNTLRMVFQALWDAARGRQPLAAFLRARKPDWYDD